MVSYEFSLETKRALTEARNAAEGAAGMIAPEDILLGVLGAPADSVRSMLAKLNVDPEPLREAAEKASRQSVPPAPRELRPGTYTREAKKVLEAGMAEAANLGEVRVFPEHLLLAVARTGFRPAAAILLDAGMNLETMRGAVGSLRHD